MVQKQNKMRAVCYCRVSTTDQDCSRQERDLLQYANHAGYNVMAIYREIASGAKNDRKERQKIMQLAQKRGIDVVLVTELTRWGRSTVDLLNTLQQLAGWGVSVVAQTGFQFDLSTAQGKLMAGILSSLAEFERDLIAERIKSGLAAAKARGKQLGRKSGFNPSDKYAKKVLHFIDQGKPYRWIAKDLQISKSTVMAIVKRHGAVA